MARWFFKFLRPKIRYCEDDYCMQEILPLANLDDCRQELDEVARTSTALSAADGADWLRVYRRQEARYGLAEFGISRDTIRRSVGETLKFFPKVYVGWPGQWQRCKKTVGFGYDSYCAFFADWSHPRVIEHLWVTIVVESHELERS